MLSWPSTRTAFWLRVATIPLVAAALACGDSAGPESETSIIGNYALQTINGSALPFALIQVVNYRIDYTGGRLVLAEDGRYITEDIVTERINEAVTRVDTMLNGGSWTRADTLITLNEDRGPPPVRGSIRRGILKLTIVAGDSVYLFSYSKR